MQNDKRIALVTNAADFLGPAAVSSLLNDDFLVVANCYSGDKLLSQLSKQQINTENLKIVNQANAEDLISHRIQSHHQLDVVVSNDAYPAIKTNIERADLGSLQKTLDALVYYPYALFKAAIPHLKHRRKGSIIMITSCRTELPEVQGSIPDIARAGSNALMQSLSIELAPAQIAVNAIAPNYYYSEAYFPKHKFIDDKVGREFIENSVPIGRLGTAQEAMELISYLANLSGAFHTGSIIKFAGGWPYAPQRPSF